MLTMETRKLPFEGRQWTISMGEIAAVSWGLTATVNLTEYGPFQGDRYSTMMYKTIQ